MQIFVYLCSGFRWKNVSLNAKSRLKNVTICAKSRLKNVIANRLYYV